jgi:tetratricopeptide (TPR) repeat protein
MLESPEPWADLRDLDAVLALLKHDQGHRRSGGGRRLSTADEVQLLRACSSAEGARRLQALVLPWRARCRERKQQWEEAAHLWRETGDLRRCYACEALALESRRAWGEAGRKWEETGQPQKAAACWERSGQWKRALIALEESGAAEAIAGLLDRWGKAAVKQGDYAQAAEIWARLGRSRLAARNWERAGQWEKAGSIWVSEREWEDATRCWEQARRWDLAAEAWERAGKWEMAARAWERAGREPEAAACRARLAESAEDWKQAAREWERAARPADAARCRERAQLMDLVAARWRVQAGTDHASRRPEGERASQAPVAAASDAWYCRECRYTMGKTAWDATQTRKVKGLLWDRIWYRCPRCEREVELYPGQG